MAVTGSRQTSGTARAAGCGGPSCTRRCTTPWSWPASRSSRGRSTTVHNHHDHVLVDGEPASYLVAADGLHSPIRRRLGLDLPPGRHRRFGLRSHVATAPWTSYVEVHWARGSEAYVTPVGDDLVGVAILTDDSRPFAELLAEHPLLVQRLAGVPTQRVRGAGPLRQRSRRRTEGRVLLVGDAAGYVDALTGEGIALGLAQARAAVEAIRLGRAAGLRGGVRPARPSPRPADQGPPAAPAGCHWSAGRSCRPRPGCRGSSARPSTSSRGRHDGRAGGPPRRVRCRDRHRGQGRGAPPGHPAAPGVLVLRLRRGWPVPADPAGAPQADLRRRLDQLVLRPSRARRAHRGRRAPSGRAGARGDPRRPARWCCRGSATGR